MKKVLIVIAAVIIIQVISSIIAFVFVAHPEDEPPVSIAPEMPYIPDEAAEPDSFAPEPEPAPAVEPAPQLAALEDGSFTWLVPGIERTACRVLLDNGTDCDAVIRLAAEQVIALPAGERLDLASNVKQLVFDVLDQEGSVYAQIGRPLRSGVVYVYNHQAARDYMIDFQTYSTFMLYGDDTPPVFYQGLLFFEVNDIDYFFGEEFPEEITISTFGGIGQATRSRLGYVPVPEDTSREITVLDRAGGPAFAVRTGPDVLVIQHPAAADTNPETYVYIDNPLDTSVDLYVDDTRLTALEAGGRLRLHLEPGDYTLKALAEGDRAVDRLTMSGLQNGHLYIWALQGLRQYTFRIDRNTMMDVDCYADVLKAALNVNGLRFFECPASVMYDPFVYSGLASINTEHVRMGTLEPGEAETEPQSDLSAVLEAVKQAPAAIADPVMRKRFDACMEQINLQVVTSPEVWVLQAMLASAAGDNDSAYSYSSAAIAFGRQAADAFRIRGRLLFEKGEYAAAKEDLEEALRLDGSLKAELEPLIGQADESIAAEQRRLDEEYAEEMKALEEEGLDAQPDTEPDADGEVEPLD